MLLQDKKDNLIELFDSFDDFCLAHQAWQASRQLEQVLCPAKPDRLKLYYFPREIL
jgi:hypothetical protein